MGDGTMEEQSLLLKVLHIIASFIALQFVWFFFSLGIITIIPATLAMYTVILDWYRNGITIAFGESFLYSFKYYLKQYRYFMTYIVVSIILLSVSGYTNEFLTLVKIDFIFRNIVFFLLGLFVCTLIAIIPLTVSTHLKGVHLLQNGVVVTFRLLPQMIFLVCISIGFGIIVYLFPYTISLFFSIFAFIHIRIWQYAVKTLPTDFLDKCLLKYHYR